MKRYIKQVTVVVLAFVSLNSCELEEQVYSSIPTEDFYKTEGDAESAITAAYGQIAILYSGPAMLMIADFSADQVYPRPVVGRNTFTLFNYDPNFTSQKSFNRTFESPVQVWQSAYAGIEKANWVIEKVPAASMNTKRRDEIVGEAYFLRALYHWILTKNFGDIVIKTKASATQEEAYVGKSPKKDVYTQIYQDLEAAIPLLPAHSASLVKGRASKETALALFAKAALYNEDWAVALEKAQAVFSNTYLTLVPGVKDLYDVAKEDAARTEVMFAFESEGNVAPTLTSQVTSLYGPRNSDGPAYGKSSFGSIFAYQSFFDSFNPIDKRRQLLDTNYVNQKGATVAQKDITPITKKGVLVKKYMDPYSIAGPTASNIPILRLADVYLIAAEAEARLNGATSAAYGFIKKIRDRAGLGDLTPGLSTPEFIQAVLQERSWELFAEGDRWYDLTRTNTFIEVVSKATNDVYPKREPLAKHRYFPIPQDEINANDRLEQNPDWK